MPPKIKKTHGSVKARGPWTLGLIDTCSWYDKWHVSADLFDRNIWLNPAPWWGIRFRNLSDPNLDLSRSLKVKFDSVFGLPIYAFLLMFNSNIWPNSPPLQDKRGWKFRSWIFCKRCGDITAQHVYRHVLHTWVLRIGITHTDECAWIPPAWFQ